MMESLNNAHCSEMENAGITKTLDGSAQKMTTTNGSSKIEWKQAFSLVVQIMILIIGILNGMIFIMIGEMKVSIKETAALTVQNDKKIATLSILLCSPFDERERIIRSFDKLHKGEVK